ncbi:MAG: hypothetical protein SNJ59_08480 [Aggregatilineales bacterium]
MPLIVIFIFGSVIIGAGVMLSPAWPTRQPRIGLAAAFALALVMGGTIFWAMLFGWDTLVIDYLLFALVTSIFLFGTLSYGQKRAEARGEELADADQGWPGPADILFFAFVALVFIIPALVVPVPLDTDAQGFGYLALMARMGGGFQSLAPFRPEISYLYSPGFIAIAAYLSQQLGQGLHIVQIAVGSVLGVMFVLLAYDFGAELRDKRLGRAMAIAALGGLGLFTAYMDSHYTSLLGLVFSMGFLIFVFRYLRDGLPADAIAAGLMLGAVVLAHPDTTIILGLGYVPWLLVMWLGEPKPTPRRWLVMIAGIPLIALLAISPWLFGIRELLGSDIVSPFERDASHLLVMVVFHGVWIVPIAIWGAVIGLRQRDQIALLCAGWLLMVIDFSATGILPRLFGWALAPVLRYDYPFSIAWHGPIIPYTLLGGIALLWLWERLPETTFKQRLHRNAPRLLIGLSLLALLGLVFNQQLLALSRNFVSFYGAFSSSADVQAMEWIKQNTPPDARVLNHPGPHEADWVPVISERDSVYFRPQPFFRGDEQALAEQARMRAFWEDPANPAHAELLANANIDYVIVPQIVTDPDSIETMFRWRPPFTEELPMASRVDQAPYLELVFDADGAQVYVLNRDSVR